MRGGEGGVARDRCVKYVGGVYRRERTWGVGTC